MLQEVFFFVPISKIQQPPATYSYVSLSSTTVRHHYKLTNRFSNHYYFLISASFLIFHFLEASWAARVHLGR